MEGAPVCSIRMLNNIRLMLHQDSSSPEGGDPSPELAADGGGGQIERLSLPPEELAARFAPVDGYPTTEYDPEEDPINRMFAIHPGPDAEPVEVPTDTDIGAYIAGCPCGLALAVENQPALDEMLEALNDETDGCYREDGHDLQQVSPPEAVDRFSHSRPRVGSATEGEGGRNGDHGIESEDQR